MNLLQAIILGLIQGLTEFIPVSSSGHLVLVPWLLKWSQPSVLFDTVLHWGTLMAVVVYFWRDWWRLITAWLRGLIHWDWHERDARLAWLLILGTVPAVVIGYLLQAWFESLFGKPVWVAVFLLVTAGFLALAEWLGRRVRTMEQQRWSDALVIGLAQAAAIAPGISRSGATMATGLLRGMKRTDAARFSFLLSAPIILGAGLVPLFDVLSAPQSGVQALSLVAGFLVAALTGYLCIGGLLRYLQKGSLYLFSLYCTWAGLSSLIVFWLR